MSPVLMYSPIEFNSAQLRILEAINSMPTNAIVCFPRNHGSDKVSAIEASLRRFASELRMRQTRMETEFFIKNITLKMCEYIQEDREVLPISPQFLTRSGKICMVWHNKKCKYFFWTPIVASKPCKIFNKTFIKRFRGNNRGRHWNRFRADGK